MTEWPLVLFTVLIELACGLALAATFADYRSARPAAMRPAGMAVFWVAAAGLLASLFHLGHPLLAFRALLNLGRSVLSLEVLMSLLFAAAALVYSRCWLKDRKLGRLTLGLVTSVLGLAAVISSSAIYLLPSQPVWNSLWLPVSFLGTTLLLGGFAAAALVRPQDDPRLLRMLLAAGSTGSGLAVLSVMWMLASLSRRTGDAYVVARLENALHRLATPLYSGGLGLHLLLTAVVPVALACSAWPAREESAPSGRNEPAFLPGFIAVMAGVLVGRAIVYSLVASTPPF